MPVIVVGGVTVGSVTVDVSSFLQAGGIARAVMGTTPSATVVVRDPGGNIIVSPPPITYALTHPEIMTVNASTGVLTPVTIGSPDLIPMLTATCQGVDSTPVAINTIDPEYRMPSEGGAGTVITTGANSAQGYFDELVNAGQTSWWPGKTVASGDYCAAGGSQTNITDLAIDPTDAGGYTVTSATLTAHWANPDISNGQILWIPPAAGVNSAAYFVNTEYTSGKARLIAIDDQPRTGSPVVVGTPGTSGLSATLYALTATQIYQAGGAGTTSTATTAPNPTGTTTFSDNGITWTRVAAANSGKRLLLAGPYTNGKSISGGEIVAGRGGAGTYALRVTATRAPIAWAQSTNYTYGQYVIGTGGTCWKCISPGTNTSANSGTGPSPSGGAPFTVTDGGVTWYNNNTGTGQSGNDWYDHDFAGGYAKPFNQNRRSYRLFFQITGEPWAGTMAIKWFKPANSGSVSATAWPESDSHNNVPYPGTGQPAGINTFFQRLETYNDNVSAYPTGHDQGMQPCGPYLQDFLNDGIWHEYRRSYLPPSSAGALDGEDMTWIDGQKIIDCRNSMALVTGPGCFKQWVSPAMMANDFNFYAGNTPTSDACLIGSSCSTSNLLGGNARCDMDFDVAGYVFWQHQER